MDQKSKATLIKSKSSNSAVMSKSERGSSNKSRSNGEFKTLAVKKRGVYVEKRPSASNTQEINEIRPRIKAPPRSRPGTKKFLASVLTILSKSTAGTQYPPVAAADEAKDQFKPQRKLTPSTRQSTKPTPKMTKNMSPKVQLKAEVKSNKEDEQFDSNQTKKTKKPKYKSRVLNDEVNKDAPAKVFVLQSKKEIIQTPSNYSKSTKEMSNHSIKWAEFLPKLISSETGAPKIKVQKNLYNQDQGVAKCVLEGNKLNMEKQMCEPSTLVGVPEKDEKLYSLFVNLLETVYSVKPDYDAASSLKSGKSSKVQFEIDDNVTQKLNNITKQKQETFEDVAPLCSKRCYSIKADDGPTDNIDWNKHQSAKYYNKPLSEKWSAPELHPAKAKILKKKLKPQSFKNTNKPVTVKTQSTIMQERRSFYKKTKKPNLLSILKRQLMIEDEEFEEPENFYQALRVMANNKRRCQKSIHFDSSVRKGRYEGSDYDSVCRFKRRKVISPSTRLPKNYKTYKPESAFYRNSHSGKKQSEMSGYDISCELETDTNDDNESYHSLAVYGFDYEDNKNISNGYELLSSESDTESEGVKRINDWNHGFKTITRLWNC